jgi:2-keto-4-pentenoate hydratase/2-oxohepta-3-ene-1,7-dioic acid hydratase in catechol pathway
VRIALFDDWRLGLVDPDGRTIRDVTHAVHGRSGGDPCGAGWWVRLCRDFAEAAPELTCAASAAPAVPLSSVRLRPPVLNPTKIVATASNYGEHVSEMREAVLARVAGRVEAWLLDFDVFLKAPSSVIGPGGEVVLPRAALDRGKEVHHESELALVIGRGGAGIPEAEALDHVLGYLVGLDMTVRGDGDRSRRKSYDTFTPLGPWLTTADEVADPQALDIRLEVGGALRQKATTGEMLVSIAGIVAYASSVMRLEPGDVILTGAPPGVGEVHPGDRIEASITGLGTLGVDVRR